MARFTDHRRDEAPPTEELEPPTVGLRRSDVAGGEETVFLRNLRPTHPGQGRRSQSSRGIGSTAWGATISADARHSISDRSPRDPGAKGRHGDALPVIAATATGLLLVAAGYDLGRQDRAGAGLILYWAGLLLIFIPACLQLLHPETSRRVRLTNSLVLGIGLLLAYLILQLHQFTRFDEMLHVRTLRDIRNTGGLFTANSGLPVSPRFPGLEVLTNAVAQLTQLPLQLAAVLVIVVARALLIVGLFHLAEQLTRSSHAAGIAVAIYSCSPQFFFFNAQFSYQTLAVALGILFLVLITNEEAGRVEMLLAGGAALALTFSHHATSWVFVGVLAMATVAAFVRRDRSTATALLGITVADLALVVSWAIVSGPMLNRYLGPVFHDAVFQLTGIASGTSETRKISTDSSGTRNPRWETGFIGLSLLVWMATLVPVGPFRRRPVAAGRADAVLRSLRLLQFLYPIALVATIAPKAAEISVRLSTFIFIGMSIWAAYSIGLYVDGRRHLVRWTVAMLGAMAFIGGTLMGSGLDWNRIPGPYLVVADGRSIDSSANAAVQWAARNLPAGARFAADRETGALLAAEGNQHLVIGVPGGGNSGQILLAPSFDAGARDLLRRSQIRYYVVDQRLADGLPHETYYVVNGEAPKGTRLTQADLGKFDITSGSRRIYDNGAVRIYDVSELWEGSATSTAVRE
ncbi:glycosyltransferase [Frankia gtarii]|uniref:glycosyltransferase n=1 Tax=Frankia gtarii TaxID=2950102 RepID=UPI0021BE7960|nr:glycosyltransferase [Frankia gtarii]